MQGNNHSQDNFNPIHYAAGDSSKKGKEQLQEYIRLRRLSQNADLPDSGYTFSIITPLLLTINQIMLLSALFGLLWFLIFSAYQFLNLLLFATVCLILFVSLAAFSVVAVQRKIPENIWYGVFFLMIYGVTYWLITVK